jgi:hypothetical protein
VTSIDGEIVDSVGVCEVLEGGFPVNPDSDPGLEVHDVAAAIGTRIS